MPIKLLLLGPLPPPYGGPEVMTRALLDGLKGRKEFLVRHINTQVSRSLAEKGGKHQFRKSWRGYAQAIEMVKMLFDFRPDIVYLPLTNSPSFLGFLRDALFLAPALLFRKKVVVRLHGGYYYYAHARGLQRRIVQFLLGKISLAMLQGRRLKNEFNGLVADERIVTVPNGIDAHPFEEARHRLVKRDAPGPKRVLFVGLMCSEKGFHDVLAAIPGVPNADFIFAGEWPSAKDEREARAFLAQHGIENRVTFKGVVSGPAKYDMFVSSDLFVFPSYFVYEGHAVSSVEALAAGLPIVCTDHGALNESVVDGWNGYFIPRSDPAAIAARLNQLLSDEATRSTMASNSRAWHEQNFTLEKFIDNWSRAILSLGLPGASDGGTGGGE
ncbi:MAG: glycosyltransferase family 4 protein [Chloroflexota bacterium]